MYFLRKDVYKRQLLRVPNSEINKIALGIDIRSGQKFPELECILEGFKKSGMDYEIDVYKRQAY